jgi:hypothetical protein
MKLQNSCERGTARLLQCLALTGWLHLQVLSTLRILIQAWTHVLLLTLPPVCACR